MIIIIDDLKLNANNSLSSHLSATMNYVGAPTRNALKCLSHSINNSIQSSSALVAVMHCNDDFTLSSKHTNK